MVGIVRDVKVIPQPPDFAPSLLMIYENVLCIHCAWPWTVGEMGRMEVLHVFVKGARPHSARCYASTSELQVIHRGVNLVSTKYYVTVMDIPDKLKCL